MTRKAFAFVRGSDVVVGDEVVVPAGRVSIFWPDPTARLVATLSTAESEPTEGQADKEAEVRVVEHDPPVPLYQITRGGLSITEIEAAGVVIGWAETEEEFLERLRATKLPADAIDVTLIEEADVPARDDFRDDWAIGARGVHVDMAKARVRHMARIRAARNAALVEADNEHRRADDAGDAAAKKRAGARRQRLRDLPAIVDLNAAKTVDELRAIWPEELATL